MPQVKLAKPQGKASTKITIALPDELLLWADVMATVRRLERNDVIRDAISRGLLLMQAENLRLTTADQRGAEDYSEKVGGVEGFKERIVESMRADEAELVRRHRELKDK